MESLKHKSCNFFKLLVLSCASVLLACSNTSQNTGTHTVKFELCTELRTSRVADMQVNHNSYISKPTVSVRGDNPDNSYISGWYTKSDYQIDSQWDFDLFKVTSDLTLYAKWENMCNVSFYYADEPDNLIYETLIKPNRLIDNVDYKIPGYRIDGYYLDIAMTQPFDFNTPITTNTKIYIKTDKVIYFSSTSITNNFAAYKASSTNSTAGSIENMTINNEEVSKVNYGISYEVGGGSSDPYIGLENVKIYTGNSQELQFRIKNLGQAKQFAIYWVGVNESGEYVGKNDYSEENSLYYTFSEKEKGMSENDDWLTISFKVGRERKNWTKMSYLTKLRIQSNYVSKSGSDTSNIILIKDIQGITVDDLNPNNPKISIYNGSEVIGEYRVKPGSSLDINKLNGNTAGYKIDNYYYDSTKTRLVDFTSPINNDVSIYANVVETLYFTGNSIYNSFSTMHSSVDNKKDYGVTDPVMNYENDILNVNFGVSHYADPFVYSKSLNLAINGKTSISVKFKNLGKASQFAIYWGGKLKNGNEINDFTAGYEAWISTGSYINMSENDEWAILTFDLSSNEKWTSLETLTCFRFQSCYTSTSATDNSNILLIDSIYGN